LLHPLGISDLELGDTVKRLRHTPWSPIPLSPPPISISIALSRMVHLHIRWRCASIKPLVSVQVVNSL